MLARAKQAAERFSVLLLTTFASLLDLPFDNILMNCVKNVAKTNVILNLAAYLHKARAKFLKMKWWC